MRSIASPSRIVLLLLSTLTACSGTDANSTSIGSGGSEGLGGANGTGGLAATGGNPGVGGNAGGSPATGGNLATGGSISSTNAATGGLVATGGKAGTGGMQPVGGSKPTGGAAPTGGTNSAGGAQATGGSQTKATGGAQATGGTNAPGGANATGGSKATTGGSPSTGGSNASPTGGKASTGGTTSAAGGAASFKCDNLSFAPSATGKPKPSGAVGGMQVLNWAGFSSAISYTFDDANSSQINNYTAMKNAGGHYTFFLITSKTEASNAVYKTALADGNEIGNHTSDHSNCTSASAIDTAQTFIKNTFGVTAYAFAAPNGSTACNVASVYNKFLTDRSVSGNSSISPSDTSKYTWLPADVPAADGSNMAPIAGKWRVICLHGFQGGSDGAYQAVPLSTFTSAAQSAKSGGSWVETVTNVAAYNWGQKAIGTSTTSATWTLPSVFPPNMCVRITTTGGTVTQSGKEVPWDDHGYYQISLDAGSVTVQ
jgi:peptidoglycan/xylan/chitin deacetylase (PgdA/CDA1 family)